MMPEVDRLATQLWMRIYAMSVQFLPVSSKTEGPTCRILGGGWLFLQIANPRSQQKSDRHAAASQADPTPPANKRLEGIGNNVRQGISRDEIYRTLCSIHLEVHMVQNRSA